MVLEHKTTISCGIKIVPEIKLTYNIFTNLPKREPKGDWVLA